MDVLKWGFIALFLASCGAREQSFNFCDCNETATLYRRVKEVDHIVVEEGFYFGTNSFLNFNSAIGLPSGNIYDFDGSGTVDAADHLSMIGGYGVHPPEFNLCDITVDFVNSHGWPSSYPDAYFCVVHITPVDESSLFTDACPLNTFYVEVIYQDSTLKFWYD